MLIIGPDPFISQSSPDQSPESIFHVMKSRDQTSVLLSVAYRAGPADPSAAVKTQKNHVVYKTILNLIHLFFVMLDKVKRVLKFHPIHL